LALGQGVAVARVVEGLRGVQAPALHAGVYKALWCGGYTHVHTQHVGAGGIYAVHRTGGGACVCISTCDTCKAVIAVSEDQGEI
jgi:hypothetical protein